MKAPKVRVDSVKNIRQLAATYELVIDSSTASDINSMLKNLESGQIPTLLIKSTGDIILYPFFKSLFNLLNNSEGFSERLFVNIYTLDVFENQHSSLHVPMNALLSTYAFSNYVDSLKNRFTSEEIQNHLTNVLELSTFILDYPILIIERRYAR